MNLQYTVLVSGLYLQVNFLAGYTSIFHLNYPYLPGELVFPWLCLNNISKDNGTLIIGRNILTLIARERLFETWHTAE